MWTFAEVRGNFQRRTESRQSSWVIFMLLRQGCLGSRRKILVHPSAFHDKQHAARCSNVSQRIPLYRKDVRTHPGSDRAASRGLAGLIAGVETHFPNWNWAGFPTSYLLAGSAYLAINWFIAGLVLGGPAKAGGGGRRQRKECSGGAGLVACAVGNSPQGCQRQCSDLAYALRFDSFQTVILCFGQGDT